MMDRVAMLVEADRVEDLGEWERAAMLRVRAVVESEKSWWRLGEVEFRWTGPHDHITVGTNLWCDHSGWPRGLNERVLRNRVEAAVEHAQALAYYAYGLPYFDLEAKKAKERLGQRQS